MNREQAQARITELQNLVGKSYDEIAQLGSVHKIEVYACGPADYGTGASLVIEDQEETRWSDARKAGTWVSSTMSC